MVAESGSRADQAKMSFAIRNRMKDIRRDIELLKKIQTKTAEKYKGKVRLLNFLAQSFQQLMSSLSSTETQR